MNTSATAALSISGLSTVAEALRLMPSELREEHAKTTAAPPTVKEQRETEAFAAMNKGVQLKVRQMQ